MSYCGECEADGGSELSAVVMVQPEPPRGAPSVKELQSMFSELGFTVGPAVAISFSISGSARLFDDVFPSMSPVLEVLAARFSGEAIHREIFLPIDDLRAVRSIDDWAGVSAIFFPEVPEFGPGDP